MLRGALLTLSLLLGCCCGLPSLPDGINKSEEIAIQNNDPCLNVCGSNTDCKLINNSPYCTCKPGFNGDPFTGCNSQALAKPECTSSSECGADEACLNEKCVDPCSGFCGLNAICRVLNHRPLCACRPGFLLNPDKGCQPESSPECTSDALCAPTLACRRQHCVDPCAGVCGNNTVCQVTDHHPACACAPGYTGNPFEECKPQCLSTFMGTGNSTSLERKPQLKILKLSKETMNWKQALEYCDSEGMELVSINSEEEQLQVTQLLLSEGVNERTWTSGVNLEMFGGYIWFTGRNSLEYTHWATGEPSGSNMNCIALYRGPLGFWTLQNCRDSYYVMCEDNTL